MDKKKKGLPLDAVVALTLILIVLVLAFEGLAVQHLPKDAVGFPGFVFSVIAIVGCMELLRIRRSHGDESQEPPKAVFYNRGNFLVICGLITGYVVFMFLVGFIPSTILFAAVFAVKFRYRHPVLFGAAAVLVTVGVSYIFKNVMYIHLPGGLLLDLIL